MIDESMTTRSDPSGVRPAAGGPRPEPGRAAYTPPRLEHLGAWSALTLQQSVPIGPGGFLLDPGRAERLG